ncbi:MAG: alkaline phosphatase family protein [Pirellulales bacterium]
MAIVAVLAAAPLTRAADTPSQYVIHISVDGLAPRFIEELQADKLLPTFGRLQAEGAWTHNARTDFDYTITLPNHTCMVTGRPVKDKVAEPAAIAGHAWVTNSDPGERNLHSNRHDYVASVFDVAHDHGLRTGMFASKSKFVVYDQSYDARNGAPDTVDADNGRDKIDVYVKEGNTTLLIDKFVEAMQAQPLNYTFIHFADTDSAGHARGWGSTEYCAALEHVDRQLGRILDLVSTDARFKGKTTLVLSADHGGYNRNHFIIADPLNFTIPFYTWGAGVARGGDLYELNTTSRANPQSTRVDYTDSQGQPIRNGDGGNLSLKLLGLGPIPGSLINAAQDLHVNSGTSG